MVAVMIAPASVARGQVRYDSSGGMIRGCVDASTNRLRIATDAAPCTTDEGVLEWPSLQDGAPAHLVRGCVSARSGALPVRRWSGRFVTDPSRQAIAPPPCQPN